MRRDPGTMTLCRLPLRVAWRGGDRRRRVPVLGLGRDSLLLRLAPTYSRTCGTAIRRHAEVRLNFYVLYFVVAFPIVYCLDEDAQGNSLESGPCTHRSLVRRHAHPVADRSRHRRWAARCDRWRYAPTGSMWTRRCRLRPLRPASCSFSSPSSTSATARSSRCWWTTSAATSPSTTDRWGS